MLAVLLIAGCEQSVSQKPTRTEGTKRGQDARPLDRREKRERGFTIAAAGDILVHRAVAERAARYGGKGFDFRPMFEPVRALIGEADLALCHLETPLSPTNEELSGYPIFNAPREVARGAVYAGFDACSTASNHAYDRGLEGIAGTLDVLDEAGLAHAGTARSPAEDRRPALVRVKGFKVALLSYTAQLNVTAVPTEGWSVDIIDLPTILSEARGARAKGAEFVVVSLQWGVEYQREPTKEQRRVARRLLRSGAVDLILGHHAHVVQPVGRIGGKYAVYGMGNFLSNQSSKCCLPATQDGVIVRIEVAERNARLSATDIGYTPTRVDIGSYRVVPIRRELARDDLRRDRRRALRRSWRRTVRALEADGVRGVRDPLEGPRRRAG